MSSICMYCKDCDGMFFATIDATDRDTARQISKYLEMGHRLKSDVLTETVRAEFGEKNCKTCQ